MTHIQYRGKTYKSIAELCDEVGVNADTVYSRKAKTKEGLIAIIDNLSQSTRAMKGREFTFRGETYSTISQACKAFGVSQSSMLQIQRRTGKDEEEAIEYLIANTKPRETFVFQGKTYNSVRMACAEWDISSRKVYNRKNKTGQSTEEALEYLLGKGEGIPFRGERYPTLKEACKALDINYSSFFSWKKNKKQGIAELLERYLTEEKTSEKRKVVFRGETFETLSQACAHYKVSRGTVDSIMRRKEKTTAEALELAIEKSEKKKA